jgi:hypothetical protein
MLGKSFGASTAAQWDHGDWLAYHVLTAGWAAVGLALTAGGWTRLRRSDMVPAAEAVTPGRHRAAVPVTACLTVVGALVLALGLRGVAVDPGAPWWSAGAVLTASVLAAALALTWEDEKWAFVAGLAVQLALALTLQHFHRNEALEEWWVLLVQAGTVTAAVVALLWLFARRRVHGPGPQASHSVPLLGVQVALPLAGNLALLLGPLALLVRYPEAPPDQVALAGRPAGWAALGLALAAAGWYAGRVLARGGVSLLCGLGLALGVLVGCSAAGWDRDHWLAYHALTASWALLATLILLRGVLAGRRGGAESGGEAGAAPLLPWWATAVGALVLALGLRGAAADPLAPWWPAGAALWAAGLAAGLALWQRREAWAPAASVLANLVVAIVFWHSHQTTPLEEWWGELLQAHVVASAAVAAVWLAGCRRIYGNARPAITAAPLLLVQVGLVLAGNGVLLLEATWRLVAHPESLHPHVVQAGGPWAWLALAATGAVAARFLHVRRANAAGLTAAGLGLGVLAACTGARRGGDGWLAYHVLTAAWALTGLALLVRSRAALRQAGAPQLSAATPAPRVWPVNACMGVIALLVAGLALRGFPQDPSGPAWSVGAVLALGLQAAALAVWLRSETWAFVATLALDLAVSLLVWDAFRADNLESWWIQLLQANILSGSAAALLWLAANYRVYADRPPGVTATPLLSVQVFLGLAGNAVLLVQPAFLALVWTPGDLPRSVVDADGLAGWLTLGVTAAVAWAQLRLTRMQGGMQVLGSLGLGAGVLAACTAAHWDQGNWLAYHVLMAAWGLQAVLMLGAGSVGWTRGEEAGGREGEAHAPLLSGGLVREWVILAGLPVLGLALRAAPDDPTGPWWSAAAVLGLSVLAGLVGLGQRRERWVFTAGLGVNLAVSLVLWRPHRDRPLGEWWLPLAQANAAAAGLVALSWVALSRWLERTGRPALGSGNLLRLQAVLALAGNAALLANPLLEIVLRPGALDPLVRETGNALGWLALVLGGVAAVWHAAGVRGRGAIHAVGALTLAAGVLAACTAARQDAGGWFAYHCLTAGWALGGLMVVAAGWGSARAAPAAPFLPAGAVQGWAAGVGALVLGLAVRGVMEDPAGPWWSAGAVLAASGLAALLAAWQRREGWAFAASLGVNGAASLVLWRLHHAEPLVDWWARLVQANTVASSVAALVWLAAGARLYDEVAWQKRRAPLRGLQVLLGLAGNAVLLAQPLVLLVERPAAPPDSVAQAGGPWGWLTLGLALLPVAWHLGPRLLHLGVSLLGGMGLAAGVLAACTAAAHDHNGRWLAYHVLTASWALLGAATLAGSWRAEGRWQGDVPAGQLPALAACAAWVAVLGLLVLGLALRDALAAPEPWWPAGAVLWAGGLAGGLALWRRREAWAFAGALCLNLAVSLLVWHFHRREPIEVWWVRLVQANVAASAVAALAWLAAWRRLYPPDQVSTSPAPLLAVQVVLGLAGNAVLLAGPALRLILRPDDLDLTAVRQAGSVWGRLTLLAALVPAAWHLGRTLARAGVHVVGALGLGLGVLAACTAGARLDNSWVAYHTLMAGWALTGALTLAGGWWLARRGGPRDGAWPLPAGLVQGWVITLGVLVLGLALRGVAVDPAGAGWSAGGVLAASALAAGLALWQRREGWALAACAGANLAASFLVSDWHRHEPLDAWWPRLLQVNVAVAGAAALAWLGLTCRPAYPASSEDAPAPLRGLQVSLALAGNAVLLALAALLIVWHPERLDPLAGQVGQLGGWLALLPALAAGAWHWGRSRLLAPLHLAGALALLATVQAASTAGVRWPHDWLAYHVLTAGWALAGFGLLAAGWGASTHPAGEADAHDAAAARFRVDPVAAWAAALGGLALLLGLRGAAGDPGGPWWSAGAVLAAGGLAAALAVRQRREGWAFAAGLCGNLAATLLVWHFHRLDPIEVWWVRLVQVDVTAAALAAFAWLAAARRLYDAGPDDLARHPLLTAQVALGLAGNVVLLLHPAVRLVVQPGALDPGVLQAGEAGGWLALLLALGAAAWHAGRTLARGGIHVLCGLGLAVGVLTACTAADADHGGRWLAYHVLLGAWAAAGAATLLLGWVGTRRAGPTAEGRDQEAAGRGRLVRAWTAGLGLLVVALAARGIPEDPTGPWWSAAGLLAAGLLAGALATWSQRQAFVYGSGVLLAAAGVTFALGWDPRPVDLVYAGLLCLAGSAALWSALGAWLGLPATHSGPRAPRVGLPTRSASGPRSPRDLPSGAVPFAHLGTALPAAGILGLAWAGVVFTLTGAGLPAASPLAWPALLVVAAALGVSLWDPRAHFGLAGLYAAGLTALGLWLQQAPPGLRWAAVPALAAFATLAGACRRAGASRQWLRVSLGLPDRPLGWPAAWFLPCQMALATAVTGLSLWLCLGGATGAVRAGGPVAVALLWPALLGLATTAPAPWRPPLRQATLLLGGLACAEAVWAGLVPTPHAPWLERSGLLLAVFSLLTLAYGVGLARLLPPQSSWPASARSAGALLGALALALLAAVLAQEVVLTRAGVSPLLTAPALAAVTAALVTLMAAGVCFALLPGLDPLGLPERGRTGYVYAAELLLVALFAHLRLTAPDRFGGRLGEHWTFVVIAVAFGGAGLSELFARLSVRVLAEPLRRTGVFLPMLPVLAFWVRPAGDYATLWFLVGAFYACLSVLDRALGFALLAALAGNVGLWVVLHENQKAFLDYPQLWLVPFALTVLVAAHLNRDRLSRRQLVTLRYAALTVIYLASTAETFLTGLGHHAVRPLVLIGLSLLGVFTGMLLRVRAFLFLGSGFVGLGAFALVWHAAQQHSWLWYVAGIVLGVAIIVLFAFFEKRRAEVLHLLEKLRDWE